MSSSEDELRPIFESRLLERATLAVESIIYPDHNRSCAMDYAGGGGNAD